MPTPPAVPQFGALLRSHITSVHDAARPAFLSGLERSAAARYREWSAAAPEHAEVLLECAAREDEIAELVAALFPIDTDMQQAVDEALPAAVAVYYDVFAPYSVLDQLYLQSEAELQGAQAWVGIAAGADDPATREVLARCTALEQESAAAVKALLADQGMNSGTPQSGS
jgi:siderophore synthetase component